jgi:hypothetical protein
MKGRRVTLACVYAMCVRGVLNKLLSIGVNHRLSLTLTNELRVEDNKTRDAVDSLIIGAFYHG